MANGKNIDIVIKELTAAGITNPQAISAILAIISKESGFVPKNETSYSKTSNDRIRSIFSKTKDLSDQALTSLKADPVKFFNYVYGGRYGNSATEGYKYRGRGFNQLTFKGNYEYYGKKLQLDLVGNPDLVNKPEIAAKVVAAYFKDQFEKHPSTIKQRYGAKNINDFKDTKTAVNAFYNANAGLDKDTSKQTTTGKTKALSNVDQFYTFTTKFLKDPTVQKGAGGLVILALAFLLYKIS